MSSWIVTREHIAALVDLATIPGREVNYYFDGKNYGPREYVTQYDADGAEINYWTALGRMLWFENYRGVNARYNENDAPPVYEHRFTTSDPRTMPTAIEGIKVAKCYRYQACDSGEVWDKSQSAAFIAALIDRLVDSLHGMNEAPWGWTAEHAYKSELISLMDMVRENNNPATLGA